MEYNYLIIDSNATSNLQLQHRMEEYGEFYCAGVVNDTMDGINAILKFSPDVVFVNLNDNAGKYFQMVAELYQYIQDIPILIGISKSKQFAYEAIKNNFFDYWLLPFNEFDMRKTLLKLMKKLPNENASQTLCLKSYKDFQYLETDNILYLRADNNATDFIMKDGTTVSAFKTLKSFGEKLPKNFVRIHQSYIININYVSRINFGKSVCALKNGKEQLPFSKTYRENVDGLKKILSKNTISTPN
ncbi:LytTR family DNA-binding domain-containing protein [Flavobacteriaceae bacterium F89]|uniref:LytTR family DNA-binding domain-containing protein n=1 Tax=Cerina litoralis TaxID=2874477 RepID=A0AAE3EU81_9FLAO|nr:LytTR family DNA-binding domain-containing protein [Cerina litoralis]MCG2461078.1 LytTR family DNA-binding domain-containing protein [Cerina litoralis]